MCSWYEASAKATKGETCADQMTDSFQAHEDVMHLLSLEPSACDAFRACEETVLRFMCSVYGCIVYKSFKANRESPNGQNQQMTLKPVLTSG